jgi:hypothetical protein
MLFSTIFQQLMSLQCYSDGDFSLDTFKRDIIIE